MSEWQPIQTAPKDGTEFLGYCGDGFFLCAWYRRYGCFIDNVSGDPFGENQEARADEKAPLCELTHWMSLPAPPPSTESDT